MNIIRACAAALGLAMLTSPAFGGPVGPQCPDIELVEIGDFTSSIGSEITAYDPINERLWVVSGKDEVELWDISDPANPSLFKTIDVEADMPGGRDFGGVNSVAIAQTPRIRRLLGVEPVNGLEEPEPVSSYAALAVEADQKTDPGVAAFFDLDGNYLNEVTVGALPDHIIATPFGRRLLVANEGEPTGELDGNGKFVNDPLGSISVIDMDAGPEGVDNDDVDDVDFTAFNNAVLDPSIRNYPQAQTVAQDLEPEFIALVPVAGDKEDPKEQRKEGRPLPAEEFLAYVTLQENNALGVIDIEDREVIALVGLGTKNHDLPGAGLDPSNEDGPGGDGAIKIANWPVHGYFQPDGIASYRAIDGLPYLVTANEGDARDYSDDGDGFFNEETRVKDLILDSADFDLPVGTLQGDDNLGRLKTSILEGDLDDDGFVDKILSYGARSFSIWDVEGNLVYDSGDQFEQITAVEMPELFNANDNDPDEFDNRSDDKGPEPENVVVGYPFPELIAELTDAAVLGGEIPVSSPCAYAFVGLERSAGGVMMYDVTEAATPRFVGYEPGRRLSEAEPQDVAAEGLLFIPSVISPLGPELEALTAAKSTAKKGEVSQPFGTSLLVVANEDSNTVVIYGVEELSEEDPLTCDVDGNEVIDVFDLRLILAARNAPATGPNDPRDSDGDGVITILDARTCQQQCTNAGCLPGAE